MAQDNLQSQNEQEIQFKKRARRRLVGAVALVLLMIVLLPMLLEDKVGQAPKEDVVISIPSQDNQLDAKPESEPIKQVEPVQANPVPAPIVNTPTVEDKAPETQAPVSQAKPVEPPAPVVPEVQTPKKEEPKLKPVAKVEDKAKPEAARIFVQIGVFSDPENVKKMQGQLSDKGLKSQSELIDTSKGKKTRLRVGPYSSKKEAEAALGKVKALDLAGVVVGN